MSCEGDEIPHPSNISAISQIIHTENPEGRIPHVSASSSPQGSSQKRSASDPLSDESVDHLKKPNLDQGSTEAGKFTHKKNLLDELSNNRYSHTNQGPFYLYVQSISHPPSPIHPLTVGKILNKMYKKDILEIKKLGFSKISVKFNNKLTPNSIALQQPLKDKNMLCYIPNFRIFRQGIIRNIPTDLSVDEIKNEIDSPARVLNIRRLNRKITNHSEDGTSSSSYVPARSLAISFADQILPKYIFIFSVRYEVTPFIPKTIICSSCFRFGHHATQCRSKPRCSHCARVDHDLQSPCPHIGSQPTCANCKGKHRSTDIKCPEFQIQKDIQLLAADKNIPLKEAREILTGSRDNYSPTINVVNFPPLNSSSPQGLSNISPISSTSFTYSPPSTSPPLRYASYAQAVHTANNTNPCNLNKCANLPHNSSSRFSHREDHDYLLMPNGRPPYNPPNGCALSCGTVPHNSSPSPSGSSDSQLGVILQLLIQIINTLSPNLSLPAFNIFSRHSQSSSNNQRFEPSTSSDSPINYGQSQS